MVKKETKRKERGGKIKRGGSDPVERKQKTEGEMEEDGEGGIRIGRQEG